MGYGCKLKSGMTLHLFLLFEVPGCRRVAARCQLLGVIWVLRTLEWDDGASISFLFKCQAVVV